MQPPDDLVCPITHSVFRSPVITSAGTIYEEQAIKQHLTKSLQDPLTQQEITAEQLIPVYLLKNRAKQYASSTARMCLEEALSEDREEPVKYLRRACELCDEAGVPS